MASIDSDVVVRLTPDEKMLIEMAIKKIEEIGDNIRCDTDLFVDADSIFSCINEAYRQNDKKLPTVIHIWE